MDTYASQDLSGAEKSAQSVTKGDEVTRPPEGNHAMEAAHDQSLHGTQETADDNEIELPQNLRDLLQRLSGSSGGEAVEEIPFLQNYEYGDFFRDGGAPSRRAEVRLKVLQALGSCKNLKEFVNFHPAQWNLTVAEWEELLVPMQGNPALESIHLLPLKSLETQVQIGPHLQNLLRHASSLARLTLLLYGGPVGATLAADVTSGLRANVHNKLKTLQVDFWENGVGSLVEDVAKAISTASQLRELELWYVPRLEGVAKEALSAALEGHSNLRHVSILFGREEADFSAEGIAEVLAEVYAVTRPSPCPSLDSLTLSEVKITGETLVRLACSANIRELRMVHVESLYDFDLEQWKVLARCLLYPLALHKLHIKFRIGNRPAKELEALDTGLRELSKVSQRSSVLDVGITVNESNVNLAFLQKAVTYTSLTGIFLHDSDVSSPMFKSFVEKLRENTSVRHLALFNCHSRTMTKDGWEHLFLHLRRNVSIRSLSLFGCRDLSDDNFRDLMEVFQVNLTLHKVDIRVTQWEADGKAALVEEALKRNRKLAGYFSILGDAGLALDGAKVGRVFMCGLPKAGKTQLKITLMKTVGKESKSESWILKFKKKVGKMVYKLRRTKGIEVELLCSDEFLTISIWDLAGQVIFRALQSILFPRINQACIFVFVFNPFEDKDKKRDLVHTFTYELRAWLRIIVSNTQIVGHNLPQMLVVITHKDQLENDFDLTLQQLEDVVKKLQHKFNDVVKLCPSIAGKSDKLIYHINAKEESEVRPITDLIKSCMMNQLQQQRGFGVPKTCSELVRYLLKGAEDIRAEPLWSSDKFYNFCTAKNSDLQRFKVTDVTGKRVLHAVASYMHDVGAICMTPTTLKEDGNNVNQSDKGMIVVDPNWLTQVFLGELIGYGHGFETHNGPSTSRNSKLTFSENGFIDPEELSSFIDRLLSKDTQGRKVEKKMVFQFLLEMDLCYKVESSEEPVRLFMPIAFAEKRIDSTHIKKLRWSVDSMEPVEESDYFGFRVQCHDKERTSFSPAFFPRFQIHLRKQMEFEVNLGITDQNYIFFRSHIEIKIDSYYIFVEIDKSTENNIDIMVKFSKKIKTRERAMDFVQKHIVQKLIEFCASEKGCPGLQLVVAVLRTKCVERLTPRELRTESQAVLIETLKRQFQYEIEAQMQSGNVRDNSLLSYHYFWPKVGTPSTDSYSDFNMPEEFESAQTLLSTMDVRDVLTAVQKHPEELSQTLQTLHQISSQVDAAASELSHITSDNQVLVMQSASASSLQSFASQQSFNTRSDLSPGDKLILQRLHGMETMMVAGFKSKLDEIQSQMLQLTSRVDTIIGCGMSKENHKFPTRPYFSKGVSLSEKVKAKILSAHAVRLHFMCEAKHQPHFIKDQPGLELLLGKEGKFAEWMRTLSMISMKMIWFLLKIGVQVTAGLGSVVPDISNLATEFSVRISMAIVNVVLDSLKTEIDENLMLVKDDRSVDEAWCSLRSHLASYLDPKNYATVFKLHLVKYRNSGDPYAWLCEDCMVTGRRHFFLDRC